MFSKTEIEKYFIAEKNESLLIIILGIAAIVFAVVLFFFIKTNWHKGAAIPFLIFGIMQFAVGYVVYKKCDTQRMQNVYAYDMNPSNLKTKELPRIQQVNKNFVWYKYIETALLIIGIALFFYFKNDDTKLFWVGFAIALFIEAAISLSVDSVAHTRAKAYEKGLEEFLK